MLNVGKHADDTASFDESGSDGEYSLVPEEHVSNAGKNAPAAADVGLVSSTTAGRHVERGHDGEGERSGTLDDLSVPASVFLPSEIGTMGHASSLQHPPSETGGVAAASGEKREAGEPPVPKQTIRSVARRIRSGTVDFKAAIGVAMLVTVALFASWQSHVHQHETLRLREELRQRGMLLPLTLSLLAERELVRERIDVLEAELKRAKGTSPGYASDNQDLFTPEEALLSAKNCYVEASLSL